MPSGTGSGNAIVIKADGTVPLAPDLSRQDRDHYIAHLVTSGHVIEHADDGSHIKLISGPYVEQLKAKAAKPN